jgi:hypothetical protein
MNIEQHIIKTVWLSNQRSIHLSLEMYTRDVTSSLLFDAVYKKINKLVWNSVSSEVYSNVRECIKEYEYR